MHLKLKTFMSKDDGAVTVDWVVLCAAVVGLGLALVTSTRDGAVELADRTINVTPGGF
jgi:hypothetical protein